MASESSPEKSSLDNLDLEMEDMNSASRRLIDGHYAFQNDILTNSISSILGYKLRQMYLEQKLEDAQYHLACDHPEHNGESFRFYCRDCSAKICTRCLVMHEAHDVISHAAAVDEKFDNLAGAVSQFADIQVSLEKALEATAARKEQLIKESQSVKASVSAQMQQLHAQLEAAEATLNGEIDSLLQPNLSQCDSAIETLRAFGEMVRPQAELRNSMAEQLRRENLFQLEEKTRMKLMEAKKHIPSLTPPGRVKLQLQWNEKTQQLLNSTDSFGEVALTPALDPFQLIRSFNARHSLDKAQTCVESIATLSNGCLAMIDSANRKIKVFSPLGRSVRCFIGGGQYQLLSPTDIVALQAGGMIICDPGENKAVLFGDNGVGRCSIASHSCECAFLAEASSSASASPSSSPSASSSSAASGVGEGQDRQGRQGRQDKQDRQDRQDSSELCIVDSLYRTVETLRASDSRLSKVSAAWQLQHMGLMAKPRWAVRNVVSGHVFVVDPYEHCCFVFDSGGAYVRRYGKRGASFGEFEEPGQLACDHAGFVVIPDAGNHRLHLLDPNGNFVRFALAASDGIRRPRAVAFGTDCLWLVQADGRVCQFAYG